MASSEPPTDRARASTPTRSGFLLFSAVALAGTLLDLLTKYRVFERLPGPGDAVAVWGSLLRFVHSENPGIVFGLFPGRGGDLFLVVSVVALPLLLVLASRTGRLWPLAGLAAVTAGTTGNLYDRILFSRVRDFIEFDLGFWPFHPWPIFNVADSFICVGVAILLITVGREPGGNPKSGSPEVVKS